MTLTVFDSCLAVARRCENHYNQLNSLNLLDPSDAVVVGIEIYAAQILSHKMSVETMIRVLYGTDKLVSHDQYSRTEESLVNY